MSQEKETGQHKSSFKARQQHHAERFSKNHLTSVLCEKDSSRLGCVSRMAAVPLLAVLDDQINASLFEKVKME